MGEIAAAVLLHVDVAVFVLPFFLGDFFESASIGDVVLPGCPAVRAADPSLSFGRCPLVEAGLVEIVAARSLTPNNTLSFRRQLFATDRTVSFDRLALAIFVLDIDSL